MVRIVRRSEKSSSWQKLWIGINKHTINVLVIIESRQDGEIGEANCELDLAHVRRMQLHRWIEIDALREDKDKLVRRVIQERAEHKKRRIQPWAYVVKTNMCVKTIKIRWWLKRMWLIFYSMFYQVFLTKQMSWTHSEV